MSASNLPKVMVAVHELGHNLGLDHAGSNSLEYGNPFDWMGNYPDVEGLSYGMGYKLKLHWLPRPAVYRIDDTKLEDLTDHACAPCLSPHFPSPDGPLPAPMY